MKGVPEEIPCAALEHFRANRRKPALRVLCNSAEKTPVRQSNQIKFRQLLRSWQTTGTPKILITSVTKKSRCQVCYSQKRPRLTGNLRSLSCLKVFSKRTLRFTTSRPKITKPATSTLPSMETCCRFSNSLTAKPLRIGEKT